MLSYGSSTSYLMVKEEFEKFLRSIKYVIENDNGFENTVAEFTKIQ